MDYQLAGYVGDTLLHWPLPEGETRIGRSSSHPVSLPDRSVSRDHAAIQRRGDVLDIRDLGSRNGTHVNGKRITGPHPLQPGDKLSFGSVSVHVVGSESSIRYGEETELGTARFSSDQLHSPTPELRTRFDTLVQLGPFLVQDHTLAEVYDACLDTVEHMVPFDLACLLLLDEAGVPAPRASRSPGGSLNRDLAVSHSMVDTVIRERTHLLVRDTLDKSIASLADSVVLKHIRSAMVVPLFDNTEVIGVLYVDLRDAGTRYGAAQLADLAFLANLLAMKITNTRLREAQREQADEMEAAARIQRALLRAAPPCPEGYELHVRLDASAEVAGDLYDVVALPDGRYLIALGDVVGKGVAAALLMADVLATIRALARQLDTLQEVVETIHEELLQAGEARSFVTLFVGLLDPVAHRLEYVNAGHEPPALYVPGLGLSRLASSGPPAGLPTGVPFEPCAADLPAGGLLCAWSDGIPESYRPGVEPVRFMRDVEPVEEILEKGIASGRHATLQELCSLVFERVDLFLEGMHAPDDQTLLLLRRRQPA
jgi:serine phosphatase RsbU (regulator of sigma subunit)